MAPHSLPRCVSGAQPALPASRDSSFQLLYIPTVLGYSLRAQSEAKVHVIWQKSANSLQQPLGTRQQSPPVVCNKCIYYGMQILYRQDLTIPCLSTYNRPDKHPGKKLYWEHPTFAYKHTTKAPELPYFVVVSLTNDQDENILHFLLFCPYLHSSFQPSWLRLFLSNRAGWFPAHHPAL